jgi:predicted  nucleic acid-binding Zn-ribbon protein
METLLVPDDIDGIEPRVREWHEREVAALKAEVARLRERAERLRILVQRVSDMKGVSDALRLEELLIDWNEDAEAALREIAGEGKP